MKRLIFATGVLIYTLFVLAMVFENSSQRTQPVARTVSSATVDETKAESEEPALYVVKAIDGRVAVSEKSSGKIIRETDTQVALLPKTDRKRLQKGIEVKTEQELRRLLEDICS